MSGEWFANYVKAPRHPGKGRVIRALLRLADGRRLPSVYGPQMTVRSHDATNRFALLGTLAEDYRDVHAQIMAMPPGECFIDIGANLGLFTMVASRHLGPEGRVVAFEPNQKTFADLAGNLAANACTNVVTVCAGVSNTTARVAFDPGPAGHSGIAHISESGSSAIMVLGSAQGGFTNTGSISGTSGAGVSINVGTWGAADALADITNTASGVIAGGATGFTLNATNFYGDFWPLTFTSSATSSPSRTWA